MMFNRLDMKRLDLSYSSLDSGVSNVTNVSIITENTDYYKYNEDSKALISQESCLNNYIDPNWH
jgi:hypothetical protein